MDVELDRVHKPLRELRKSLKRLPKNPPPEAVHKLRTRARHIEAIAAALAQSDEKTTRRLLKSIKPVRKAAGGVRDMDVLRGNALSLPQNSHNGALTRLVERLGIARRKSAEDLLDTVGQQRKTARQNLKKYLKVVDTAFANGKSGSTHAAQPMQSEQHVRAVTSDLIAELSRWPALGAGNIHPFRLKVKELRYILQLLPHPEPPLVKALGDVKEQIGDWHDWQQLAKKARQILDPAEDRSLVAEIDRIGKGKLRRALATSNTLRKQFLKPAAPTRKAR
ncbi:MAG: CHAD domain-containing protein [Terracidiphilus sp.]